MSDPSATSWIVACQDPLSIGFSRQEYWSGLPFPSPGNLPSIGIEPLSPMSPALQADSLPTQPSGNPMGIQVIIIRKAKKIKNKKIRKALRLLLSI